MTITFPLILSVYLLIGAALAFRIVFSKNYDKAVDEAIQASRFPLPVTKALVFAGVTLLGPSAWVYLTIRDFNK